jgi:hypothetical protein
MGLFLVQLVGKSGACSQYKANGACIGCSYRSNALLRVLEIFEPRPSELSTSCCRRISRKWVSASSFEDLIDKLGAIFVFEKSCQSLWPV